MRRPTLAWTRAILGTALTASTLSAQQLPPAQEQGADPAPAPAPASVSAISGREARVSLRTGLDYMKTRRYARALGCFRDAEKRQADLSETELKDLKKGIASALQGIRDAGRGSFRASSKEQQADRDDQVALAKSESTAEKQARANSVRLAGTTADSADKSSSDTTAPMLEAFPAQPIITALPTDQLEVPPAAATDLAPGLVSPPGASEAQSPATSSAATAVQHAAAPAPADLPPLTPGAAASTKTVALADTPAEQATQGAAPEYIAAPGGSPPTIELTQPDQLPASDSSAPAQSSPPLELPQPPVIKQPEAAKALSATTEQDSVHLPPLGADREAHPAGATIEQPPTSNGASPTPVQPPVNQEEPLPPLPDAASPAPAPSTEKAPANAPPATAPATPAQDAEALPPLPGDLSSGGGAKDPGPVATPAVETEAPATANPVAPATNEQPGPGQSSSSGSPDPVPSGPAAPVEEAKATVPADAPASAPVTTDREPAADVRASAPAAAEAGSVTSLPPHLRREVDQIVLKQERESKMPAQNPAQGVEPNEPPNAPGAAPPTRLEITRAPSPTEARPLRAIPVPEEFVPLKKREWAPNRKYWVAAALCHQPLYFQDAALERYGHSTEQFFGPFGRYLSYPVDDPTQSIQRNQITQPFFSAGLFVLQIAALPYNVVMDPPWEAEYDLGYFRPGDQIPTDLYYLPLHGVGPPLRGANY